MSIIYIFMKFKIFSSVVALALIFSACSELFDEANKGLLGDNSFPSLTWSAADKDAAVNIEAVKNDTRKNASGPKITSNAHSADFPGIFFIWDSKQKDNGYLKVSAAVFAKYESFVLTAKESNTYWDFPIAIQEGQKMTSDGCYVFYIPKVYNNKNINMVFLSEFKEKRIPPCDETVMVYFHPANGGIWGQQAIKGVPFSICGDVCFEEWIKGFDPADFWDDEEGFEGFLCTFEGWEMSPSGDKAGRVAIEDCDPEINSEGVLIWAKHGENKCAITPADVTVGYNVNLLETYNEITHGPVYATSGGGAVSYINNGDSWLEPIPNGTGDTPVFDLGNGITGGFFTKVGGNPGNAYTGFTYIAIDLAVFNGNANIDFGKDPQTGGVLPSQEWNPNLKGSYNVKIVDGNLIVSINDYRSGAWDASLFPMDETRKNPNTYLSKQNRTEKNLGPVSGIVYLIFEASTITFNEVVDCIVVSTEDGFTRAYTGTVNKDIEVTCSVAAVNGKVLTYDAAGLYTVTVNLLVGGVVVATKDDVNVNVSLVGRSLVAANITVDFGDYIVGAGADVIICNIPGYDCFHP